MTRILAFLVAAAAISGVDAQKPRVSRPAVAAMEKSFDQRIERMGPEEPLVLLGNTRGVYLEGYGAVFTSEVSLINVPNLTPFRPSYSKEEIARIHTRKLQRLPVLKQGMRQMMLAAAASLDEVPATEQIAVGVSLFYFSWEDTSGLPGQVLMLAEKQKLLDAQAGRTSIDSFLAVREF